VRFKHLVGGAQLECNELINLVQLGQLHQSRELLCKSKTQSCPIPSSITELAAQLGLPSQASCKLSISRS